MTEIESPSAAPETETVPAAPAAVTAGSSSRGLRKVRVGQVVSDAMDKTVVVVVVDLKQHPMYKKVIRRSTKFLAHDEANECGKGDRVRIMETRPMSKRKRWRVVEIVEKAR